MIIQKLLIQYFLEPLACFMDRFSQKARDAVFVLSGLMIFLVCFARETQAINARYLVIYVISCALFALMILCSLKKGMKPVKFRGALAVCWFGVGMLMLLSGVLFNTDYIGEALLFLAAYPVAFIVWQNGDAGKILKNISRSIQLSFAACLVLCVLFYPVEDVRYQGLFNNLNGAAIYYALPCACFLLECIKPQKFCWRYVGRLLALGVSVSLLVYTASRTGILSFAAAAVAVLGSYIIANRKNLKVQFFRNVVMIALSSFLCFNITIYLLQLERVAAVATYHIQNVIEPGSAEMPEGGLDLIAPGDMFNQTVGRLDNEGLTVDQISTGRLQIWEQYLRQLNLFGHADSGTAHREELPDKPYHTAHMAVLQISYENGVVAGVLYLAFNLSAGVYSIWYALKKTDDIYAVFPLMITAVYAVSSVLASTNTSFLCMATFIYYLVQFPLLTSCFSEND